MAAMSPRGREVAVGFQRFKYSTHQMFVDGLGGEHFFQQFVSVPNSDLKVLGQLVHTQIIGDDYSSANLVKSQHTTIRG